MTSTTAIAASATARRHLTFALQVVLIIAGFVLVAALVRNVGLQRVLGVLRDARTLFPVVAALEVCIAIADVFAAAMLLGKSRPAVITSAWLRSTLSAYAATILLPAGRAAGEAARAIILSRSVGAARATAACSHLQSCALLANAAMSMVCGLVVIGSDAGGLLAVALLVNGLVCGSLGAGLLAISRSGKVAAWLRKRFHRFVRAEPSQTLPSAGEVRNAVAFCFTGRAIQAIQYGVIVRAVGGSFGANAAMTALGIHLVGAAIGDLIPNQLGATEGAYRAFASTLGFATEPARALSIALMARTTQLLLALFSLVASPLVARQPRASGAP
jgi:hypothetical protein